MAHGRERIDPPTASFRPAAVSTRGEPQHKVGGGVSRVASNVGLLLTAEVACRGASLLATLSLTKRLLTDGYGRVEFAFNIAFWLVLIVRDCFETIVTREVARHPRLTRGMVGRVVAMKLVIASALYVALCALAAGSLARLGDAGLVARYGLLLFTTAIGIDFVFRGREKVGWVALSLCFRTLIYCVGVLVFVRGPDQIALVPSWLVGGEFVGIALVWLVYCRGNGWPRLRFSPRFLAVILRRGRSVALIQLCQAVLVTADLLVVGLMTSWSDVGRYGAPHRMVAALMAFGVILQQVLLPSMAKSWRRSERAGREVFAFAIRVAMLLFVPISVGGTILAEPLVRVFLPTSFHDSGGLLAIGIWRAPLLSLAFLYQTALIAVNREAAGLRLLIGGAIACVPCIALGYFAQGLAGASWAVLATGLLLVGAGYGCMAREGHAPPWHHHLRIPLMGSAVMVPVCLASRGLPLFVTILLGASAYGGCVWFLGGFREIAAALRGTPWQGSGATGSRRPDSIHAR